MNKETNKYRQKAADARAHAEVAATEKERTYWLAIAIEWERLAEVSEIAKRK
jgi:hypothetical protein